MTNAVQNVNHTLPLLSFFTRHLVKEQDREYTQQNTHKTLWTYRKNRRYGAEKLGDMVQKNMKYGAETNIEDGAENIKYCA